MSHLPNDPLRLNRPDLYPLLLPLHEVRPGDQTYLLAGTPMLVTRSEPAGVGEQWALAGTVPAAHPLNGEQHEISLLLERDHQAVVYRLLDVVLDEQRARIDAENARFDATWQHLVHSLEGGADAEP